MNQLKDPRPRHPAVEAYLTERSGPGGLVARALVDWVRQTLPTSVEGIYHRMPSFALPDGAILCHIEAHANHANLGFGAGIHLPDPANLLRGSGKSYRFVRLERPELVGEVALEALLMAAIHQGLHGADKR